MQLYTATDNTAPDTLLIRGKENSTMTAKITNNNNSNYLISLVFEDICRVKQEFKLSKKLQLFDHNKQLSSAQNADQLRVLKKGKGVISCYSAIQKQMLQPSLGIHS